MLLQYNNIVKHAAHLYYRYQQLVLINVHSANMYQHVHNFRKILTHVDQPPPVNMTNFKRPSRIIYKFTINLPKYTIGLKLNIKLYKLNSK